MDIEPNYFKFGFRRTEIFDLIKRRHGINLESTAAKKIAGPTNPEPIIPEWANRRKGIRRFTLKQAAFALSGLDPMHSYSVPDEARADVNAVSIALFQAIQDGVLVAVAVDTAEEYEEDATVLAVQDLKQWADSHGYSWPIPLPPALDPVISSTLTPAPIKATAPTMALSQPPAVAQAPTGIAPDEKPLGPRERNSLHRIIGALLELAQTPRQNQSNHAGVIIELTEKHRDKDGISERNLQTVFAEAKRILRAD